MVTRYGGKVINKLKPVRKVEVVKHENGGLHVIVVTVWVRISGNEDDCVESITLRIRLNLNSLRARACPVAATMPDVSLINSARRPRSPTAPTSEGPVNPPVRCASIGVPDPESDATAEIVC